MSCWQHSRQEGSFILHNFSLKVNELLNTDFCRWKVQGLQVVACARIMQAGAQARLASMSSGKRKHFPKRLPADGVQGWSGAQRRARRAQAWAQGPGWPTSWTRWSPASSGCPWRRRRPSAGMTFTSCPEHLLQQQATDRAMHVYMHALAVKARLGGGAAPARWRHQWPSWTGCSWPPLRRP